MTVDSTEEHLRPSTWEQSSPESFGRSRFLNRELSWLDFALRLLDLSEQVDLPILERVKFLAIVSSGLDEFFQVRVAGVRDQLAAGLGTTTPDGMTPTEQLAAIRLKTLDLMRRHTQIYTDQILPGLARSGVEIIDFDSLSRAERSELVEIFEATIFPVLTPLAVDPGHPFPYISNLSLNLAVSVADPNSGETRFARVKVPPILPRFVQLPRSERFIALEQVIAANLDRLFPDMVVGAHYAFRVTRNADLDVDDNDADDLLAAVELELRRRRFGRAVRLEVNREMKSDVLELLLRELELLDEDVYAPEAPLDLAQLMTLVAIDRPDLKEPAWAPMTPARLGGNESHPGIFGTLRERDILVHHPYDSFATSVESFITEASMDPDVLAIKQTLYRTSGDAQFVSALARAAESGKQVAALVELTARFEEQRNIGWARQLERAGVHVVYGVVGLKTHSKTALVVRREEDGIRRYCHIGTGNYNSETARHYEDIGILTSDPDLGADLTDLFNYLTGFSHTSSSRRLVLAPRSLRRWVLDQIEHESSEGPGGRIAIKLNGLTDSEVIDSLYRASQRGVEIRLIVRGPCSIRPGVPGLSETITVRSLVGRFLEHSRIYRFGSPSAGVVANMAVERDTGETDGANPARYFIGSPDLMARNLDHRIEALVPVLDEELCGRLEDILTLDLLDDTNAWELEQSGSYSRVRTIRHISAQHRLQELAIERARRRSLDAIS